MDLQEASKIASEAALPPKGNPAFAESARLAYLANEAAFVTTSRTSPALGPTFWLHFHTDRWRPNHRVTIRTAEAGWARDLLGLYRYGAWHFELPKSAFPRGIVMKFLLDGDHWMVENNKSLDPDNNHHFMEEDVTFSSTETRFRIPYDNFVSEAAQGREYPVVGNTNEEIHYEVIIIGSGMGGGILADALSDKGVKTLVLDAGGVAYPSHINNLPGDWVSLPGKHQVNNFENKDGSELLGGVQMSLGGRSVFWSGLIPRMRDWELSSWPSVIRNYLTHNGYDQAERLMRKRQSMGEFQNQLLDDLSGNFPDFLCKDLPRSRHQPNLKPDNQLDDVLETPTGVFSSADLLLDSLAFEGKAGRDNLTVNLNHLVTEIETENGRAKAVICQDLAGNRRRRYTADRIVLSAGSLESPRLALQSNLNDPNGKIGRGLTDHPAYFSHGGEDFGYNIPSHLPNGAPHPFGDPNLHAKVLMQHKQADSQSHSFNVEILLNGWFWDLRHSDDDVRRQRLSSNAQSEIKFTFIFASDLNDANWVQIQSADQRLAVKVARNPAGEQYFDECKQLRNRLLDFFRVPGVDPDSGLGNGNQGTPHHAGGTLRMSDDGTGVVNTDLKFEAYENIYACDNSVFPAIPCANPSLTLGALALRLADHLAQQVHA
ncbi:GMC oxidoreductase [Blastopirellula retiformator]|uniref:GMC oxidoreductase n=1 Tax=Blastopirellula retiformator TaxID=2527970 RepID=UPI0016476AC7|nr:GMC oxidoreductase [Blastopirellula retiformator]